MTIIRAAEIKAGMQVPDVSGFLFEVAEVVKETPKTITVRLCSDFSSFAAHWTRKKDGSKGGAVKTFRKSTLLYIA